MTDGVDMLASRLGLKLASGLGTRDWGHRDSAFAGTGNGNWEQGTGNRAAVRSVGSLFPVPFQKSLVPLVHRLATSSLSTAFTSMIGVPSIASRCLTRTRSPSTSATLTRWSPIGFGRCGERVLKTPSGGLDVSPRG